MKRLIRKNEKRLIEIKVKNLGVIKLVSQKVSFCSKNLICKSELYVLVHETCLL